MGDQSDYPPQALRLSEVSTGQRGPRNRVTDVDSASAVVTRWADPLALIKEGKGRLLLAKAQMALGISDEGTVTTHERS